jgi:hypothetical protein
MAKNHVQLEESKERKLFITRNSNYAKNCPSNSGYLGDYHNVHHLVPCTSINHSLITYLDKKKEKAPTYLKALSRFTDWNVNLGYNLIGLPFEHAYALAYNKATNQALVDLLAKLLPKQRIWKMAAVAIPGAVKYPVHLPTSFGHVKYNKLVEVELDMIWTELAVETDEKHEPIDATDMGQMIKAVGDGFKALLVAKVGQTESAWNANKFSYQFMMI